jgi:hypothetical protein
MFQGPAGQRSEAPKVRFKLVNHVPNMVELNSTIDIFLQRHSKPQLQNIQGGHAARGQVTQHGFRGFTFGRRDE